MSNAQRCLSSSIRINKLILNQSKAVIVFFFFIKRVIFFQFSGCLVQVAEISLKLAVALGCLNNYQIRSNQVRGICTFSRRYHPYTLRPQGLAFRSPRFMNVTVVYHKFLQSKPCSSGEEFTGQWHIDASRLTKLEII